MISRIVMFRHVNVYSSQSTDFCIRKPIFHVNKDEKRAYKLCNRAKFINILINIYSLLLSLKVTKLLIS